MTTSHNGTTAHGVLDLGALPHPSIEGHRLLDQALTAADEFGMTSLAKRAPTTRT